MTRDGCAAWREAIVDRVDGVLAATADARVAAHLTRCDRCRALADDLARIRRGAAGLGAVTPAPAARAAVLAAIEREARGAPAHRRRAGTRWRAGVVAWRLVPVGAAAAVLLAIAAWWPGVADPPAGVGAPAPASPVEGAVAGADWRPLDADLERAARSFADSVSAAGSPDVDREPIEALDSTVAANLAIVDAALAETRAVVRIEADDRRVADGLVQLLQLKATLLQDAIAVADHLRKGE